MQTVLKAPQSVSTNRRDSGNSTCSFYGSSLRSDGGQNSRRSSAMSQVSNALQGISPSTMNGRAVTNASPYDPISPGSSRRSSGVDQQNTTVTNNEPNSLASSSNTLISSNQAQFQKLHRRALGLSGDYDIHHPTDASTSTIAVPPQRMDNSSAFAAYMAAGRPLGNSQEIRRMSDPCSSGSRQFNGMGNQQINHHAFLHRYQNQGVAHNVPSNGGASNGSVPGHQQPTNNVNGSFGDEFIIPDDMATYLSEVQSGGNVGVTNHSMNQVRPSTCPPASVNQLPPPPPYNQAVAGHHNGMSQNGRSNHHAAQQTPAAYSTNTQAGYGNMSAGGPASYASSVNGSAPVASPYTQVSSPAYSHASSMMSPKNSSVPMHSPMSVSCMSPPAAVPPSPSAHQAIHPRSNVAAAGAVPQQNAGMVAPVNTSTNYCPPTQNQQHNQAGNQHSQNYPYHANNQFQGYSNGGTAYGSNHYNAAMYPQNKNTNAQNQYNQQPPNAGFYNANSSHYPAQYNCGNYSANGTGPQNYNYSGQNHQHYNCQCPPQQHTQQSSTRGSQHQQVYWQQNQSQQQQSQNAATYNQGQNNQSHAVPSNNGTWNAGTGTPQNVVPNGHYPNNWNPQCYQNSGNFNKSSQIPAGADVKPFRRHHLGGISHEIQCQSVTSQSQSSHGIPTTGPSSIASKGSSNATSHNNGNRGGPSNNPPVGMRPDTYQRTLEYVQQCQLWSSTENKIASNGGVPTLGNMPVNSNSRDSCNPLSPDSTTTDGKNKLNTNSNNNSNIKPSV